MPWVFSRPRMYCATCGTSSTIRRRVWSLRCHRRDDTTAPRPEPSRRSGTRGPDGRLALGPYGHEHGPIAARREGCRSYPPASVSTRRPASSANRRAVSGHESKRVVTDPTDGRLALAALLEDRGELDRAGCRVVLGRAGLRHDRSPRLGLRRGHSRMTRPSIPREILRVGQPDVHAATPPGARCAASARNAASWAARVPRAISELRARKPSRNVTAVGKAKPDDVGLDELEAWPHRSPRARHAAWRGPASRGRCRRR